MNDEIQPFVVYRIDGDQLECALWQLKDGQKAIALFLSADSATTYRTVASLGPEWKVFSPAREPLLELLRCAYQLGIKLAALEPDLQQAKRLFDIGEILKITSQIGDA
ncbi:hypothetical protein [Zavarzinella formosa]|uniref:hypothetical protein n=1 Tax=Zavarzinella formosa TaxID=360055 RepID=UPI0003035607|nr:hypothetical protein [Zavarzinella formosa]